MHNFSPNFTFALVALSKKELRFRLMCLVSRSQVGRRKTVTANFPNTVKRTHLMPSAACHCFSSPGTSFSAFS